MAAPDQLPKITDPLVTREPSIHGPRTMASDTDLKLCDLTVEVPGGQALTQ